VTAPEGWGDSLSNLQLVRAALAEDVGDGDRTTLWTVPKDAMGSGRILAKQAGVIAGVEVVDQVFREVDPALRTLWRSGDGDAVAPGEEVAQIEGPLRSILTAERTALNFLGRLSGIATLASRYAVAVRGTGARVIDTRKTTPGWRELEKAAVLAGGCRNHRHGLYDMVLIKENHIHAAGGIGPALEAVREKAADEGLDVEVEVRGLGELDEALREGPDRILLDNMSVSDLREAVRHRSEAGLPEVRLECSGGVTLDRVREIAETGVDFISVGALTHSASALDLTLLIGEGVARAPEAPRHSSGRA